MRHIHTCSGDRPSPSPRPRPGARFIHQFNASMLLRPATSLSNRDVSGLCARTLSTSSTVPWRRQCGQPQIDSATNFRSNVFVVSIIRAWSPYQLKTRAVFAKFVCQNDCAIFLTDFQEAVLLNGGVCAPSCVNCPVSVRVPYNNSWTFGRTDL